MHLRRTALTATVVITSALLTPTTATADSSTLPAAVDAIVQGDLEPYEWMLPAVNADQAHSVATGAGVTVAVIDTGVDVTHPDLENQVVPGALIKQDPVTDKFSIVAAADVNETAHDWFGHGSHVSGIVAGDDDGNGITGIAPDAKIMPIDLLPSRNMYVNDYAFWRLLSQSIDYATANGADVINMSLGGRSSGIVASDKTQKYLDSLAKVCDSVSAAEAAGTVVVSSAGNEGVYGNPQSVPASCDGGMAVAALDSSLHRTFWSSYDAAVDVAAPGQDILSVDSTAADESPTPHLVQSGTSMASPVVAGVAALLVEEHPGWTAQQVQDQITSTAKDMGVNGRDPEFGWGVVDAAAAVGAPAPAPTGQNFFTTWFQKSWGGSSDDGVVSWTPPTGDPVNGYTVTVYNSAGGTSTFNADGDAVRVDVVMPVDSWYTLTASTSSGDVTTYPAPRALGGEGGFPPRLRHLEVGRHGDTLTVSWRRPNNTERIDIVQLRIMPDLGSPISRRLVIDHTEPFPRHMDVKLPDEFRWNDLRVGLELVNKVSGGSYTSGTFLPDRLRALYGSRVEGVDRAGAGNAEVTGGMSPSHMNRVCGRDNCAGEHATLVIDRGRHVEKTTVTFTTRGVFHEMVAVPKGTKALKIRIDGPKSLDSGPFRPVPIH